MVSFKRLNMFENYNIFFYHRKKWLQTRLFALLENHFNYYFLQLVRTLILSSRKNTTYFIFSPKKSFRLVNGIVLIGDQSRGKLYFFLSSLFLYFILSILFSVTFPYFFFFFRDLPFILYFVPHSLSRRRRDTAACSWALETFAREGLLKQQARPHGKFIDRSKFKRVFARPFGSSQSRNFTRWILTTWRAEEKRQISWLISPFGRRNVLCCKAVFFLYLLLLCIHSSSFSSVA